MSDIIGALLLLSTLMFAYYKYIIGVIITAPLVFVYTLIKDYNVQQYHFAIDREIRCKLLMILLSINVSNCHQVYVNLSRRIEVRIGRLIASWLEF